MKVMKHLAVLAAASLALLSVGCGGSAGDSGGELEGISWALRSIDELGKSVEVDPASGIGALFENGRVSGSAGVNTYSAPYEVSGASLDIGPAASTLMAGPPEAMELEASYLAALERAASFSVGEGRLTIYDSEGNAALFFVREEPLALVGTSWLASAYNDGREAVVSPIEGSELTVLFEEDGSLSGYSGVNTFRGEYALDGDIMTIGALASTEMASEDPELMRQEAAYLAALEGRSRISMRGGVLELRREDGALAVSFIVK